MKRVAWLGGLFLVVVWLWPASASASASSLSLALGVGFDPTGVFLVTALTERGVNETVDLRAEVGIATGNLAGLMLLGGSVLVHQPFLPLDPFAGAGVGLAVTRVPSIGLTLEGILGTRIVPFMPFGAFLQLRYIVRLSASGLTAGPLYEAGLFVSF